jgi:Nucleotidyl transferase AbiEii toxin, Type IV TA system
MVALEVAGPFGFALAGGYAVRAHGIGDRPSGDVDLFTDWHRRADFPAGVDAVIAVLERHDYSVEILTRGETFARLLVTAPDASGQSEPDKLELLADWRAHPPVFLEVGPVLHLDDAVANKMCALYGRALPRDFLDVDAIVTSGRFTREQLLALASNADGGFDPHGFAHALGALTQITDAAFGEYGVGQRVVSDLRRRFTQWREELLKAKRL